MRATEFLKEDIDQNDINEFFSNTTEYFSVNKNPYLVMWRGDKRPGRVDNLWANTRRVLEGRAPTDTNELVHHMMNDNFASFHDFPFRSGLMCSGSKKQAVEYGSVHILVPGNGGTCCYPPNFYDMYQAQHDAIYDIAARSGDDSWDFHDERDLAQEVYKMYRAGEYKSGPQVLPQAIQSNNEIMLYPTDGSELNYYLFTENFWQQTMLPLIGQQLGTIVK